MGRPGNRTELPTCALPVISGSRSSLEHNDFGREYHASPTSVSRSTFVAGVAPKSPPDADPRTAALEERGISSPPVSSSGSGSVDDQSEGRNGQWRVSVPGKPVRIDDPISALARSGVQQVRDQAVTEGPGGPGNPGAGDLQG